MISQKSYKDFELLRQVTQNPITKKVVHASRHQSDFFSLLLTLILGLPVGGEGGRRAGIVECTLEASIQGRAPPLSSDPSLPPGHPARPRPRTSLGLRSIICAGGTAVPLGTEGKDLDVDPGGQGVTSLHGF